MIFKVMRIAGCLKERAFLHIKRIILVQAHSIELMFKVFVDGDFERKYYIHKLYLDLTWSACKTWNVWPSSSNRTCSPAIPVQRSKLDSVTQLVRALYLMACMQGRYKCIKFTLKISIYKNLSHYKTLTNYFRL